MTRLMGGVSRQSHASTFPPDRFFCLLDELPLHLIPRHATGLQVPDDAEPLFLNPDCMICPDGVVPEELSQRRDLLSGFSIQGTMAWVRRREPPSLLPFWLGPEIEAVVRGLRPEQPVSSCLPRELRNLLAAAKILVSKKRAFDQPSEQNLHQTGTLFRERGYAPLASLIHPFHVAALRRYYRYLIRSGALRLGDGQSSQRYVAYNEPVARFFHHQIAATLSTIAGEPLKPSYVYLASYFGGAELQKHTDREQCEFSVTLCLDFSPEPELETPWPIHLDTPAGTVTVYQAMGDGLAYRGTRLPHYRSKLGEGLTSTSIFFHYVAADFPGSLR
ncbi:MAG: hypothetical protein WAN03_12695 [Candidatus Sulfotelmatobacter sp.]